MPGRVGVCSWSLQPGSPEELAERVRRTGLDAVQLALDPLRAGAWDEDTTFEALRDAGIHVISGMLGAKGEDYSTLETIRRTGGVRPDEHWAENLAGAARAAAIAGRNGIGLVTFHAGFIPHDASDPERPVMLDRLRRVADVFGREGVRLGLETGQESAETLLGALDDLDRPTVGVNFDPANMILYGMGDPVDALRRLAPRLVQVHIKDATPTETPGTWGTETPAGKGAVDWETFFGVLTRERPEVDLLIERESGESRIEDIRAARAMLERVVGKPLEGRAGSTS